MNRNDPITGKFKPGNPGRPKGSKNMRTRTWEEVGSSLVTDHAGKFADVLERLMSSDKVNDQVKGAELFLKVLEYFKPKVKREEPDADPWSLRGLLK
ncbi:MAG TPA: hypothetical protein PLN54_00845 [Flavobacteriales bacterium]|nr:hypothetical protein [Flavobacteriales bacterium]